MLATLWLRQFKDFGGTTWWRRKICHQHDVSNIHGSEANVPVRIHLHERAFQWKVFILRPNPFLKSKNQIVMRYLNAETVIRVPADSCLIAIQKQTTLQTAFSVIRFNFHLQLFTSFSCWWMILLSEWYFRKIIKNWIWNWLNDTWLSYNDKSAKGYNIDLSIIL